MKKHFTNNQIEGELRAQNDVYTVRDNLSMDKLILSQTILHSGKETRGHHHDNQEEVYFFIFGSGTMILGDEQIPVVAGDIVVIPDGEFHRVINTGETDLVFNTVYNRLVESTTVYAKGVYE